MQRARPLPPLLSIIGPLRLVSADEDADKFMIVAFAPKGMEDIDCHAWVVAATEGPMGMGKGGGKADSAQFTVPGVSSIDSVLEKAKCY